MYKIFIGSLLGIFLFAGAASAACTAPTTFTSGTTADASAVNANFTAVYNCATSGSPTSTRTVLTTASTSPYTPPAGVRQLRVRMKAGGGGGNGDGIPNGSSVGSNGGNTVFNSVTAAGGIGGTGNIPGPGGTGGSGTATGIVRIAGATGMNVATLPWTATTWQLYGGAGGGAGGGRPPSGNAGLAAVANSGGGGSGAGISADTQANLSNFNFAGGGGEGEYVELIINSIAGPYAFTVGAGGTGGGAGTSGFAGGAGGSGIIVIDEYY